MLERWSVGRLASWLVGWLDQAGVPSAVGVDLVLAGFSTAVGTFIGKVAGEGMRMWKRGRLRDES